MKFLIYSCLILSLTCLDVTFAYNCSGLVTIDSEGTLNYLANVALTVPKSLDGDWTLDMETDVPFTFLGGWGVWVNNLPEEGKSSFRSRLENYTLAEGDQVSFRFRISWFKGEPRPLVTSLKWEGVQLCSEFKNVSEVTKLPRRRRTEVKKVNYRKRYFVNL